MRKIISILLVILPMMVFSQKEKYPTPTKNNKLLFFIQRNLNANTIVYEANYDKNGLLNEDEPVKVYWKRYQEHGQKMELRTIEKWYAYGFEVEKKEKNLYELKLVADKNHKFWIKQLRPYKTVVLTKINNTLSILDHIYIYADYSGIWPSVKYIELFGEDAKTKTRIYEKIIID